MVVRAISICAGAGGLDRALSLAVRDARTVCYVEHEVTAAAVLAARIADGALDDAPVWSDLRTFEPGRWRGCVDLLMGGIPCQPWSVAGKREGADDPRHLWPDALRVSLALDVEWIFIENVGGFVRDGYFQLIRPDLESAGYGVEALLLEAADVGASHRRERLFILARRDSVAHRDGGGRRELAGAEANGHHPHQSRATVVDDHGSGREPAERELRAGQQHTARCRVAGRRAELADAAGQRTAEQECEPDEHAARPRAGGGSLANAELSEEHEPPPAGERRSRAVAGTTGGTVADTGSGARRTRVAGKGQDRRTAVSGAGGRLADASRPGLERGERGELADEGGGRSDTDAGGSGLFPPGPVDGAWREILARSPDDAPAVLALSEADLGWMGRLWADPRAGVLEVPAGDAELSEAVAASVESALRGVADGVGEMLDLPRTARLRLTGNGVVPLQAAVAFAVLARRFGWEV